MDWRKIFLVTYWLRGRDKSDFNVFTFYIDVLIFSSVIVFGIITVYKLFK